MARQHSNPPGHWRMRIAHPFSMGVRQGDLFAFSGQADLAGAGEVRHPGDRVRQATAVLGHVEALAGDLGCTLADITRLVVYYLDDGSVDEAAFRTHLAQPFGRGPLPTLVLVPLADFFYPGLCVEMDAYGVADAGGQATVRLPEPGSPFSRAVRCGRFTFIGALTAPGADVAGQCRAVLDGLDRVLGELGADRGDIVKINNWYVGGGTAGDWAESARVRAAYYPDPGPVATGIPLPRLAAPDALIQTDCWLMHQENGDPLPKEHSWPAGHWDWPIRLPFRHGLECGGIVFAGGQVALDAEANVLAPGDVAAQARTAMNNLGRVLGELDTGFADVFKLNTFYRGRGEPEDLHRHLAIRGGYFAQPGPASTGIPVPVLAYPDMEIEIEAIALSDRDG